MEGPGSSVLDAFGLRGKAVPLAGGAGRSVRVGDVVLKPVDDDLHIAHWIADVMSAVVEDGFRIARPVRSIDGTWSCDGWTASTYVDGVEPRHGTSPRWSEIITAGRAFHQAIADVPWSEFLNRRSDPWAIGDRVAWRETDVEIVPELAGLYAQLMSLIPETPNWHAQLIHGDLTGNVLFASGQPPAVIDFSPYWRPVAFSEAIVVADAWLWHGAEPNLLDEVAPDDASELAGQVVRAIVFRLVVTSEFKKSGGLRNDADFVAEVARYERAARWLDGVAAALPIR